MNELGNSLQNANMWSPSPLNFPYCQYQYIIGVDEELVLNAMRRDPKVRMMLVRTALEGLLKCLEGK